MSDKGEHLLNVRAEGGPWQGYVAKTNRGWAALPDGRAQGEKSEFLGFRTNAAAWDAVRKIRARDERLGDRPVSKVFDSRPLYGHLGSEEPGERRDWTVTIAGSERHDGEAPYTYVVSAESREQAWAVALSTHIRREESVDCYIVPEKSREGAPAEDCAYHWNDLRPQHRFWDKLQELVELLKKYDEEDKPNRDPDGYLLDEKQEDHDHLVGDYEMDAFPLAEDLAVRAEYV
ncbi:hypothetical protein [Streptomyces sp. NPDC057253]|uniref:hypothetical protein n=1 Tax=Streptomyces sp. NPDC057253 TaxID=3346069 RepID=UPI003638E24D